MHPSLIPGRVTIGIPTYGRADLAERAARSVLAQTYADLELVISDDFNLEDDSEDRIEALRPLLASGHQLRIVRQPQRLGLAKNFDACLQLATGEFFLLLGDDDVLHPTAIEKLVAGYTSNPHASASNIGLSWSSCEIVDANGSRLWTTEPGPALESPADLLTQLWTGRRGPRLSSILMRTAEARDVGGFQQQYGDLCDIATWAQSCLGYTSVTCIAKPLTRYTNHQQSATSRSSVEEWQQLALVVHRDLVKRAQHVGNLRAARMIAKAKTSFLGGIALTILMQTIGRPGWIGNIVRESIRKPGVMFSPFIFRRALKDGWKVIRALRG
jgi:hypothetical protein